MFTLNLSMTTLEAICNRQGWIMQNNHVLNSDGIAIMKVCELNSNPVGREIYRVEVDKAYLVCFLAEGRF